MHLAFYPCCVANSQTLYFSPWQRTEQTSYYIQMCTRGCFGPLSFYFVQQNVNFFFLSCTSQSVHWKHLSTKVVGILFFKVWD